MIKYRSSMGLFFGICGLLLFLSGWISGQWLSWQVFWNTPPDHTLFIRSWTSAIAIGEQRYIDSRFRGLPPGLHGSLTEFSSLFGKSAPLSLPTVEIEKNEGGWEWFDQVERSYITIPYWLLLLCYLPSCYVLHKLLLRRQRKMRAKLPSLLPGDGGDEDPQRTSS